MAFVQAHLSNLSVPAAERQQALNRTHADPGVPKNATTPSFWLKEPHPQFAQKSSNSLPTEADVVIIGSGVTGASIARTLLQNRAKGSNSHPAVVMLEARDICSGATGRNGGHILETADEYAEFADMFGEEAARKMLRFRLAHLREILGVAEELGLTEASQARKVQFLSAFFGDEEWKAAKERLKRFKDGMPEESKEWISYERDSIPEVRSDIAFGVWISTDIFCRNSSFHAQLASLQVLQVLCGLISLYRVFSLAWSRTTHPTSVLRIKLQ